MHRWSVVTPRAARAVASAAIIGLALPAAASADASAHPPWLAPGLVALAVVALVVLALLPVASGARVVAGKGGLEGARGGVFVVTREAHAPTRVEPSPPALTPEPAAAGSSPGIASREGPGVPAPGEVVRTLSARMDEVTYLPGSPNVLSMTKRLGGDPAEAAQGLRWTRGEDGGTAVLGLEGSLDAATAPLLAPVLDALVAERRASVVLDLSGLHHVDGAGAAALAGLAARCRERGGELRAVGVARQPRALFRLLGLDRTLAPG